MLHLVWYIIVGLIAGFVAKSVMHLHMTLFWTTVLGLVGVQGVSQPLLEKRPPRSR